MLKIGFTLSSEEFGPQELVEFGQYAEKSGFDFLMISDHYHPWTDTQGESPFVWNVIGALSQATKKIPVGIGVTAPIMRYHPAIIAQAAATSQVQMEGRFFLGVGTGENLNEHIVGMGWPQIDIRREMLTESIEIMKQLWSGGYQSYQGEFYSVEDARIYTLPKTSIPIIYSAFGPKSAAVGGEIADGFVTTSPRKDLVDAFRKGGGTKKPVYGQMSVVYETTRKKAQELLLKMWPLSGLPAPLNTELRLPSYFENTATLLDKKDLSKKIPLGRDVEKTLESIDAYMKAGFDHVYIHNIGPHQKQFIKWFVRRVLPRIK